MSTASAYARGLDVLGYDNVVLGAQRGVFDSLSTYDAGDVVTLDGRIYYRAVQRVAPPWFLQFSDGDVPGKSDKWVRTDPPAPPASPFMGAFGSGWNDLSRGGQDVLGAFDIAQSQRQMNGIKQTTVGVARDLLRGGMNAIGGAIAGAGKKVSLSAWDGALPVNLAVQLADIAANGASLPGGGARKVCLDHLKWHEDNLKKFAASADIYPAGDDLKKWVMQAFVEGNAVDEGSRYLDLAWTAMWAEIKQDLAALPEKVRAAVVDATSGIIQEATGVPAWAWGAGIAALLGLAGFVVYKVATGPVGGAVASAYLPARRR